MNENNMNSKNSGKKFLIGVISGAFAGSLIALLYAPTSGKRLRKDIVRKKDELIKDANKYLRKARVQAVEIIEDGKRKAEEIIYETKKKVEDLTDSATKLVK